MYRSSDSSVAWGDYDNDGYIDIALTGRSGGRVAQIYHNNGDHTFTNINAGLTAVWDASVAWGDFDNDSDLDILISGEAHLGQPNTTLYRNNDCPILVTATDPLTNENHVPLTHTISLTFAESILATTVNTGTFVAQGMMGGVVTGTYSVNGANTTLIPSRALFPIEVVRTSLTNGIQNLNGKGTDPYQWQFTAGEGPPRCVDTFTNSAGLTSVWQGSAAWGDYNGDGFLDILHTGITSGSSRLAQVYRNNGDNTFTNISAGLTGVNNSSVAWGRL